MSSLWPRLAGLELTIEVCAYAELAPGPEFDPEMHTTRLVRLRGAGEEGVAEDITQFISAGPELPLAGDWTLAGFCDHLAGLDQWPEGPPESDMARRWRTYGYESAALDLALRQAGRALHEVLGLEPRPITFVNSLGLGDPPDAATIERRLAAHPGLRFKLDAAAAWTPEIVATLVGTGAVDIIDFKGRYGLEVEDGAALLRVYARLIDAFPDALLEDPHDERPEILALLEPHAGRVSYDAPIQTVADLDAQSLAAGTFNVKPCRVGHLEDLFALYAACTERGAGLYGGGMGELGVGRGQIQCLASLFHADGPNDIAPSGYNAREPAAGLAPSPLPARPAATGFRRDE